MRTIVVLMMVVVGIVKTDSRDDEKILGGSIVTDIKKIPYFTFLKVIGYEYGACGGTIITTLWVVTACHCVAEQDPKRKKHLVTMVNRIPLDRWTFVAGTTHSTIRDYNTVQYRKPNSIVHHPKCQISSVHGYTYNDLGLVKMKEPFRITEYVKPVKLFSMDKVQFEGQLRGFIQKPRPGESSPRCIVAGFGRTEKGSLAEVLWGTRSPIPTEPAPIEDRDQLKSAVEIPMNAETCVYEFEQAIRKEVPGWFGSPDDVRSWREDMRNRTKNQICIQSKSKNDAVCIGDSGGGLVCDGFIIGVVSWSFACTGSTPQVLQNLLSVFGWFENNICNIATCQDLEQRHNYCTVTKGLQDECKHRTTTRRRRPLSSAPRGVYVHPIWLIFTLTSVLAQNTLV